MATIGDVAREAGVSRSTVSAVLTGRKFVRPDTRERIERAIDALDFTVNSGARALATSRTMVIGVVVRLHSPEFSPALAPWLFALSDAAQERGYDVQLLTEIDAVGAIRRVASTRRVDGLVLMNIVDRDDPRLSAVEQRRVPAVLLGVPRDPRGIDAVDLDFGAAARRMVDHLHEHGHRDVLLVQRNLGMVEEQHSFVLRFGEAVRSRAGELGMRLTASHCPPQPHDLADSLTALLRDRGDSTALVLHDDAAVVLLPEALHRAGLQAPQDISVVSLHSTELATALGLPFTSVESDSVRISRVAIEVLLDRIAAGSSSDEAPVVCRLLGPRMTDRGSVGPPPAR